MLNICLSEKEIKNILIFTKPNGIPQVEINNEFIFK